MSAFGSPENRLSSWLANDALPLWSTAGRDPVGGGFYEQLDFSGRGDGAVPKRVRVQARQIYVMSHAHILGYPNVLDAAEAGFSFLTRHGWAEDGGFVHLLSPSGTCLNPMRDTYDHAFVLLALAWFVRATGSTEALRWIDRTVTFLETSLADPATASYHESLPPVLPRRQNPHMHLFEAFLALFEATGQERFLAAARGLLALCRTRFIDSATGTLREFFDDHWAPAPGNAGQVREPGHHYEWAYLLTWFEALASEPVEPLKSQLFGFAVKFGSDPSSGLIYDSLSPDGRTVERSKRCWVQTEALRASLVMGDRVAADRIADALLTRYLDTDVRGLWIDQFGEHDEPLSKTVPASTLYHLMGACVAMRSV